MTGKKVTKLVISMMVVVVVNTQDLSCPRGSPIKSESFYVIGASGGDCKVDISYTINHLQLP